MPTKIVTQSATEPVTLADMKTYLRVDIADDDALIGGLITAARNYLEGRTKTQLSASTVEAHLDRWPVNLPAAMRSLILLEEIPPAPMVIIALPVPIAAVSQVQYRDPTETWQTLDPSLYVVDVVTGRLQVTAAPSLSPYLDAVKITCTVGGCSPRLAQALKSIVSDWYFNREPAGEVRGAVERIILLDSDITLA